MRFDVVTKHVKNTNSRQLNKNNPPYSVHSGFLRISLLYLTINKCILFNYSRVLTTCCILIYSNCMSEFIFITNLGDNVYNPYNLEAKLPFPTISLREYLSANQAAKTHGKT